MKVTITDLEHDYFLHLKSQGFSCYGEIFFKGPTVDITLYDSCVLNTIPSSGLIQIVHFSDIYLISVNRFRNLTIE